MVLLTIKEYLRVGQQGILENDDFQHTPLPTHILDITVKGKINPDEGWTISKIKDTTEEETIPREAWTVSEKKLSKAGSLKMLTMIGNILVRFLVLNRIIISEKRLLPLTVFFVSIVYFAIAASFYFE